jgi:hypothetical protein
MTPTQKDTLSTLMDTVFKVNEIASEYLANVEYTDVRLSIFRDMVEIKNRVTSIIHNIQSSK